MSQPSYTSAWWSITLNVLFVFPARYNFCFLPRCSLYNWGPKAKTSNGEMKLEYCPSAVGLEWPEEHPSHLCSQRLSTPGVPREHRELHWWCSLMLPCISGCLVQHLVCDCSQQGVTCFRREVQTFPQVWDCPCDGFVLVWQGNANIAARNEGCQQNGIFWVIFSWTDLLFIVWFSLLCLSFSKIHSLHSSKAFSSSQREDSSGETAGEVLTVDNGSNFLCAFQKPQLNLFSLLRAHSHVPWLSDPPLG